MDEHLLRRLRTLQRIAGGPSDSALARRSGVSAASFSEVFSGKRRPSEDFVARVVAGCLALAREGGQAAVDGQRLLQALRLPGHTAAAAGILERDADLDRCSAALEAVWSRRGGVVAIEGPAGIGKSELLARVCAEAAVRGIVPLGWRGSERERALPFVGVRGLLARWVAAGEERVLFAGAASLARIPLGLRPASAGGVIGQIEALYWLLVNATAGSGAAPVLLAIDDAHWCDEESLEWLGFLASRVAGLPVVIAVAYRSHEPAPRPVLAHISLKADVLVRPQPLSKHAVRTLVGLALGKDREGAFSAAFHTRSGGNPFYLRWMVDLARERGLAPGAAAVGQVDTLTPRNAVVYLNERLDALGPGARRLAQAAAILGPDCALDEAARLAGLAVPRAKSAYDRLCRAAILADGTRLDFRHPIIRSAVYDAIEPSVRSDLHLAAARRRDAARSKLDTVAAHLLEAHTGANPWVVERLTTAAEQALASGLAGTAARYLRRALAEPPPGDDRSCEVRLRYGQALALGPVTDALPELVRAYREAPGEALRAQAAVALAKANGYADRLGEAVRGLDDALGRCTDPAWRERLVAEQLLWAGWWARDAYRRERMNQLEAMAPSLNGSSHVHRLLLALHAWHLLLRGEPRDVALDTIRPVIDGGLVFTNLQHGMEVGTMSAFIPMLSGRPDRAEALFTQAVNDFQRDGWRGTHLAFARTHVGNAALRQGRPADAVADAEIALRLADRVGERTPAHWFATGTLIQALLARGQAAQARSVCERRGYAGRLPDALILPVPQAVHGALLLSNRDRAAAVAALRGIGAWLDETGLVNPAWCGWRFDLATALRNASPREAAEIATVAHRQAERFGCPSTLGRAVRTLALVRAGDGVELLEESARLLRDAPDRLELGLTLAELGSAHLRRGRGREALTPLAEALALAQECGALGLRDTVARQLGRAGGPVPPDRPATKLLPRQRRAAQLAADGCSDSDIAHAMVLDLETARALVSEAHAVLQTTDPTRLRRLLRRA